MYSNVAQRIEDLVDEPVDISTKSYDKMSDEGKAVSLESHTKLSSTSAKEKNVYFRNEETGTQYAECRYFLFHTEDIALIQWLEVHEDIRSNGIGRILRSSMIADIEAHGYDTIYTNIIDSCLISVVIDQGFKQINHGGLEGWFVKEP